jgi:hypothetical protein
VKLKELMEEPVGLPSVRIRYLSDVQKLIRQNAASTNQQLAAHAMTLMEPRKHGSTTNRSIMDGFRATELERLDHPAIQPDCIAFKFTDEFIQGRLGAVSLQDFKLLYPNEWVTERKGVHGNELYCHISEHEFPECNDCTVIIGEFAGELAVFTWHPGAPLVPGTDMNNPNTAVKLI